LPTSCVASKRWIDRHETVSRCRGRIEQVLDRCKALGHRSGENPAAWRGNLDNLPPSPKSIKTGKETHHAAVGFDRVPALVATLRGRDTRCASALELLILCAARSGEISGMRWSEIDLDAREWRLPAERMKARKPHVVPLGGRAMAILKVQPRRDDDFVFDLGRDDLRDCLQAIDPAATVHALRSDFSTWAGERTNFARDVVERVLAHVVGNAVERSYRRGEEIDKRRGVLNAWERFMVNGDADKGKIVDIHAA
jgi:integrase